jgi:hypothetical protein
MQLPKLSDRDLLAATIRAAGIERHATVDLIALLSEVDTRRLYLGEGCSSLFAYCTRVLHSRNMRRITASRRHGPREFPVVLDCSPRAPSHSRPSPYSDPI